MYATQLNHLSVQGSRATTWGHIWLAHPGRTNYNAKGQLMVLLELPSTNARLQVAAADLITGIEEAYYGDPQDSLELSLEAALRRANAELPALAAGFSKRWADTTRAVVAVHRDDLLVFATVGSVWTFLLTPHRTTTVTDGGRHTTVNPLKPFSSLTSGHLPQNSAVCFTTGTLLDYVSTEKLRKLCVQMSPLGVTQRLEELLEDASPQLNVLTIILRRSAVNTSTSGAADVPDVAMTSERSIQTLAARRDHAATLTGVPSLRQSLSRRTAGASRLLLAAWAAVRNPALWRAAKTRVTRQAAVIGTTVRNTGSRARRLAPYLWPPQRWLRGAAVVASNPIRKARRLNRYAIATVAVATIAAVAVAQGIIVQLSNRQGNVALSAEWQQSASASAEEATSALIYGDEERAAAALTSLGSLLSSLSEAQHNLAEAAEASQTYAELSRQLGRFVDVPSLGSVGSFPAGPISHLALSQGRLWAATSAGLTALEVATGSTTAPSAQAAEPVPVAAADRTVVAVTASGALVSEAGRPATTLAIGRAAGHKVDTAAALYLGRLYVLDGPAGQLFRYRRRADGFLEATAWLSAPAAPGQLRGVAIDGQAYLLTSSGVERYTQGAKDDLRLAGIWPPAQQLTHLAASGSYLYLLEPSQARIITVSKKTGQLERQYRSAALSGATALAVDGDRVAYVAVGQQVLSLDLTQR